MASIGFRQTGAITLRAVIATATAWYKGEKKKKKTYLLATICVSRSYLSSLWWWQP